MSESKDDLSFVQNQMNPFFRYKNMVEFYDEVREDQVEESDVFLNLSQDVLTKNIYDNYNSFFYRYQDYNQINR